MLTTHPREPACLSDLLLDQLRVGELPASSLGGTTAHLETCPRCQEQLAALEQDAAAFSREQDGPCWLSAHSPRSPRSPRSWMRPAIALTAILAAALALVWIRPASTPTPSEATVRLKGHASINIYVRHDDRTLRADPRTIVHPGDALRIATSVSRPSWIALFGLDARGTLSLYHPIGDETEYVPGGTERLLDMALELDDVLGEEAFIAVFCDVSMRVEPLREALAQNLENPALPEGCLLDRVVLEKQP